MTGSVQTEEQAVPTPPRADLIVLRDKNFSRQQMAEYYGVNIARVKRWIRELKIPPTKRKKVKLQAAVCLAVSERDGLTLVEQARLVLGARMGQDYRGFLLDGRPVRVDVLIRSAGLKIPDVP